MTNSYYNPNGKPANKTLLVSKDVREQLAAVGAGFDKLPALTADSPIFVNSAGTGLVPKTAEEARALLGIESGFKSALNINPDFIFDQINEGALYTVSGAVVKAMDGWSGGATGIGAFKCRRVSDPDNAAQNAMEITCTTADASIAPADNYYLETAIEGRDLAAFNFGLANALPITIKLRFKTNVTGLYGVAVYNDGGARSYRTTINVIDANEHDYAITLIPDVTGTWNYTSGAGAIFRLTLAAGAILLGSDVVWSDGLDTTVAGQCNFMSSTSNVAFLKKFHVIPGAQNLDFAPPSYVEQLAKCQRYFRKTFGQGVAVAQNSGTFTNALAHSVAVAGVADVHVMWPSEVEMRAAAVHTFYNPAAANNKWRNWVDSVDSGTPAVQFNGASRPIITFTQVATDGIGEILFVHATADARLT